MEGYYMKAKILSRTASVVSAAAILGAAVYMPVLDAAADSPQILINEICTGNTGANGNLEGEYDWIELYNPTDNDADISGWKLIKDGSNEYTFGSVSVPAKSYTIVFCAKKYAGNESYAHAGYNLSGSGVALALSDGENEIDTVTVPALDDDTVWARQPDGSADFSVLCPTPGESNNDAESAIPCNAPEFSAESGMYSSAFDLTMSTDEGSTIYYTTDGTDPATSSTRKTYSSAINIYNRSRDAMVMADWLQPSEITPWNNGAYLPSNSAVDKGTVIRAVTLNSAGKYSETVTKTYFVGVSNADHNDLPIMSVTTDPASLFDYETGINRLGAVYQANKKTSPNPDNPEANYNQKGKEWERLCHIDFFESDGTLALSQDCGFRTQGAYSRADYQKSFRFYAREEYGEKNFKYTFFDDAYQENGSGKQLKKFKKLVMRNGGNDTFYTKFKDSYIQSLVSDRKMDTQEGRPCVLFIDGEYWGIYTLQEDYDDKYYEENYDVNSDEVVVYKKGEIDEGLEEDIELFKELRNFAKNNDLSKAANYKKISEMFDLQSFADYMAAEMYIINEDWPGNNYSMWRTRTVDETNPYADGRWRMNFYDTEMGVDHYGNNSTKYNRDNLSNIMKNTWDDLPVIFNALIKNNEFKAMFVNSMMDMANINFAYSRTDERLQKYMDSYYPELSKFFARFPTWANTGNATDPCINRMKTFLKSRPSYVPGMLKSDLGLSAAVNVSVSALNPDGGQVFVNTSAIDVSSGMSGKYFPGVKITLTAKAEEGYTFAGWTGTVSSTDETISVDPANASNVKALFIREGDEVCKVTFTDGTTNFDSYVVKGTAAIIPDGVFKKTGYTPIAKDDISNVQSDMTCNITYTGCKYTIKYNPSSGVSGATYTQAMTYGQSAALLANNYKKTGYAFIGWGISNGSTVVWYKDRQVVTDLCNKEGGVYNLYPIWGKDIAKTTITLSNTSFNYNGSVQKPTVTVKDGTTVLKSGTDYTVSYRSGSAGGAYTVTVKGKGKYGGSISKTYYIKPGAAAFKLLTRSQTSMKIDWNKANGASSYKVYRKGPSDTAYKLIATTSNLTYTDSGLKSGTIYGYKVTPYGGLVAGTGFSFTNCTKSKITKLNASSGAKTKVTFKWNKLNDCSGYQIVYCNKKNGVYKALRHLGAGTTSYTHSGIKSGSTWYFKIRAYTLINGSKYFSDYSAPVMVKVK